MSVKAKFVSRRPRVIVSVDASSREELSSWIGSFFDTYEDYDPEVLDVTEHWKNWALLSRSPNAVR